MLLAQRCTSHKNNKGEDKVNELKIDQEFKNLIPPLSVEEKEGLEKSLQLFGCRDKIITWRGIIIDGHNRYEICTKNEIEFETLSMDYDFENEEEVKQWIIKNQFARRNISSYQRSILALQLKESIAAKAKENQLSSLKQNTVLQKSAELTESKEESFFKELDKSIESRNIENTVCMNSDKRLEDESKGTRLLNEEKKPIDTLKEIAQIAGVGRDTIHKVETIENEAPEVIKEAAKENTISINKAYNITKEIKDLEEEEKQNRAEELLDKQYIEKAKQIDKEKKIADKIADVIYGILTTTIDKERIGYYLEYSPQESLDKHISRCDEAITKLEEIKNIFEDMKKIKVVK